MEESLAVTFVFCSVMHVIHEVFNEIKHERVASASASASTATVPRPGVVVPISRVVAVVQHFGFLAIMLSNCVAS